MRFPNPIVGVLMSMALSIIGSALPANAVQPQAEDFQSRDAWIAELLGKHGTANRPHLKIIFEDAADGLSREKSWRGTAFQIGSKTYSNGLAFNSNKRILVDVMINANEGNQKLFIDRYGETGIGLDYWWMDAGWYIHDGAGWPKVGTWEVDTNRFPNGLRAVTDYAHAKGLKTLLWFEQERVAAGTWLAKNHPEWVLGGTNGGLLNLGIEGARKWLTEHVDGLLKSQGIDLYRQDFNMDPLGYWRGTDHPDKQGLAEIGHVTGYLAYWDELKRRHPDMLIDSCASGGRRNDIETMRRAVPLWRSDYAFEATGHQCMMYGLSFWLPYHGTGTVATRDASYYGA